MKNDVCIKAGSYCPICKGVVLADCRHDSSQFSVPMRYQRMEFNAQLQNEVKKLTIQRDELLAAVEKLARQSPRAYARAQLALPTDDTALQARLKEERERCAVECEQHGPTIGRIFASKIRSMK